MWKYDSPIGTFYIEPTPNGEYALVHEGIDCDQCESPQTLADNFLQQVTNSPWDSFVIGDLLVPNDLSEWTSC